jgi:excisionase family DNA binding protein
MWLTAAQVAENTGLSVRTVWEHAEAGRLSGVKTTPGQKRSQWRFKPVDVDRWLEAGRVTAA